MNRRTVKWVWICTFMAMMLCQAGRAVAQSAEDAQPQDNPFESILKKQPSTSPEGREILDEHDSRLPELSVATVELKYVEAVTVSEAFSCLSSEMGKIVPRGKGNSLIVFDTPKTLEKIVAEIKKADRPVESLRLQYVTMTYVDVKGVQDALNRMVSSEGSIIPVEKTNGMILCDTKLNVEAMVKEIKTLDHPRVGLQVLSLAFEYIDASSAKEALTNMLSSVGTISIRERTNSMVVCDLPKNLEEISKEAEALDLQTPGLVVETVNLKFLDARNVVVVLANMLSQYGSVVANDTTNTVIICDTKDNAARIVSEVKKVDKTPSQIMVEVTLLDVRLDDDKEIGLDWEEYSRGSLGRQNGMCDADGDASRLSEAPESNVDLAGGSNAVNGRRSRIVGGTVTDWVNDIQATRDVKILASPSALVLSGRTASIQATEQVPYEEVSSTSQGGPQTSTGFMEVGVTLEVTAVLTDDEQIVLTVEIEQNVTTGENVAGVPAVDTRKEKTSLLLNDGQVVIMGGLRRREKTTRVTKVPLLGDLPFLGNLYRTQHDIVLNSELVVLLSARIHRGEAVPNSILNKYNELKEHAPITGGVSQQ